MKPIYAALLAFLLFSMPNTACAFGRKQGVTGDHVQDAFLAGDETGLVDCGYRPEPGFCVVRKVDGAVADKSLFFIGPPAQCDRAACVYVTLYNEQGTLVWGDAIPKGKTRVEAPWSKILGCAPGAACLFHTGDRGFWVFNHVVYWKDSAGHEQKSTSQGEVVLRVHAPGYLPLDHVANDPNFVWSWSDNGVLYKMTTGLRAFVGAQ